MSGVTDPDKHRDYGSDEEFIRNQMLFEIAKQLERLNDNIERRNR